jgi:3-hydroxyisobutyrate dehydrogenase/glyoxylate/succinic semialdehyde reductase
MSAKKITFIGLGIMGSRMAKNLLKSDVDLTVANRSPEPVQELVAAGAKAANTYIDAVHNADIVFTMLAKPEAVEEVALSEDGFLHHMKPGALWVDCSTVNPSFSLRSANLARKDRMRFLDAPVAGTKPHAEKGELTFFVGGDEKDLEEARPFMEAMGQKVLHIGKSGQGASFKMLVNGLLAQSMIVFSETVLLGEKMGLDREFLLDTLPNLVVSAPFTKFKAEMIRSGEYDTQFPLELMQKDLHLVTQTAYEKGQPLFLANLAKEVYAAAVQEGLGREDFAAIHRYLEGR